MTTRLFQRLTLSLLVFCVFALCVAFPERAAGAAEVSLPSCPGDATVEECSSIRGGAGAEGVIHAFLSGNGQGGSSLDHFHIHGWRWHTMSLVREVGRLKKLAGRAFSKGDSSSLGAPLEQAVDYVVGFNLKGLHKIEADLFFPWMRKKLTSVESSNLSNAFATMMDQLESDRKMVAKLGESILRNVALACDASKSESTRFQAIESIAEESAKLERYTRSMMERENTFLVPAIALIVPESEQKSFNNKVLMSLGILDSRLHLVGMHEAVWKSNNSKEKELFKRAIPSIPQMMIPRWKRNLYEPRTKVLDQ